MISLSSIQSARAIATLLERNNKKLIVKDYTLLSEVLGSIPVEVMTSLLGDPTCLETLDTPLQLGTAHDVVLDTFTEQIAEKLNQNMTFIRESVVQEVDRVHQELCSNITDIYEYSPITVGCYKDSEYFLNESVIAIKDYVKANIDNCGGGGAELKHQLDVTKLFKLVKDHTAVEFLSENPDIDFMDKIAYATPSFYNTNLLYTLMHILYAYRFEPNVNIRSLNGVLKDIVNAFDHKAMVLMGKIPVGSFVIPNDGEAVKQVRCMYGYSDHVHVSREALDSFVAYLELDEFSDHTLKAFLLALIRDGSYGDITDINSRVFTKEKVLALISYGEELLAVGVKLTIDLLRQYTMNTVVGILETIYGEQGIAMIREKNGNYIRAIETSLVALGDNEITLDDVEVILYDIAVRIVGVGVYGETNAASFISRMNNEIEAHGETIPDAMLTTHMDNLISFLLEQIELGE